MIFQSLNMWLITGRSLHYWRFTSNDSPITSAKYFKPILNTIILSHRSAGANCRDQLSENEVHIHKTANTQNVTVACGMYYFILGFACLKVMVVFCCLNAQNE